MNDKENQQFREKNLYDLRKYKENPLAFLKKICILPNFKEENLYFAKFEG